MDDKLNQERLHVASMNLMEMRENRILTDVVLNCKGGDIHAHRCVLMASNAFFYNHFVDSSSQATGCNLVSIDFEEIPVEAMSAVVSTLYGDAPHKFQSAEEMMNVLEAAHHVKDKVITTYCMSLFLTLLTLDNCIQLWYVSTRLHQSRAENCAKAFIIEHLPELLRADKLSNMSAEEIGHFVGCASELMCVGDELLLLVVEWAKKNRHENPGRVTTILNNLDKLVFSVDCIVDLLNTDGFVRTNPELIAYLTSAKAISHTIPIVPSVTDAHAAPANGTIPIDCGTSATTCTCSSRSRSPNLSSNSSVAKNLPSRFSSSIRSGGGGGGGGTAANQTRSSVFDTRPLRTDSNTNSTMSSLSMTTFDLVPSRDVKHRLGLRILFYSQPSGKNAEMTCQTYSLNERAWGSVRSVRLSSNVTSNWYPVTDVGGQQFYFAISLGKTFVAYNEDSGRTYVGPTVTFQSRIAAVCGGTAVYVWSYESIAQFNTQSCMWKTLAPNHNVAAGWSNLLTTDGQLYFHAAFPAVIYKYNFERDDWEFEKSFQETYNVKSVKCKCVCTDCKGRLYFIVNDKQLVFFDTKSGEWVEKGIPDFKSRVPLLMNCDELFIMFSDKRCKSKFFLYYPETNHLELMANNMLISKTSNIITCDLAVVKEM